MSVELDTLFDQLSGEAPESDGESAIEALRTFIREAGGDDVLFGRTTLLSHLSTMEEWLIGQGARPALRVAALAHGLYGWKADLTEKNRSIVRLVAGDAAERLAWLFAATDDTALATAMPVTDDLGMARLGLCTVDGRRELVTRNGLAALEMLSRASRAAAEA